MSVQRTTEILETSGASYTLAIAKSKVPGAEAFVKFGYNPAITTNEEDLWPTGAGYVFPTAAAQWRIAAGNAADRGYVIKGNAEGADQTVKCDAGGSGTILLDANVDFSASTAVAVGDCVLLDPKGASPEFGYVTDITDAATGKLVIGGGFSGGGSCATARAYSIVDKSNATGTGAQVVEIYYLTSAFVEKKILVVLNGATAVDFAGAGGAALTDTFRLNEIRVVAVGTSGTSVGAIAVHLQAAPNTVYGGISAGYTLGRDSVFTVPAGKTLYITAVNLSAATNNDTKIQTARMTLRATQEEYSGFSTPGILHPQAEALISNSSQNIVFDVPLVLHEGVDMKTSMIGLTGFSGPGGCVIRGWLERGTH